MKLLKNKLTVTIIVLSVAFLGLIVVTVKREGKGLESSAGSALNPIQKIAYNMNRGVKDFVDFFLNFSEVKEENKELTKENAKLENKLTEYSDLAEKNEELQKLLDFKDQRSNYDYIATNIIGVSGGNILDGYIVDKGSDDGVQKGMVVIAADGLMGQVSSVGKDWSIIQCIINENIAVSVMSESTRENGGILKGYKDSSGKNLAKVVNLSIDSTIKEGDVILTSGLGMLYPKEIRVGEVVSVEEDKVKVMKSAVVKPYVDFNKLEELLIIAPKDKREIKYN
ncbi:rod shape-determining protein MreC [Clostridium paraputrificum]|uniref:rod shape-determining protein MreC n=1 Tax=Clostridium TaxID=1485 RepID=UPI003D32C818